MFPLYLWVLAGAGIVILGAYLLNHYLDLGWNTATPIVATFLAGSILILSPLTAWAGFAIGRSSALSYNEWWNGVETRVSVSEATCLRDGICQHTYSCDPYLVTTTSTDVNGKVTTKTETRYHSCPYVDREFTWQIHTTLGTRVVGDSWFPENPTRHLFRITEPFLPNVPTGTPAEWTAAKKRIDAGTPKGVKKKATYVNYFLASGDPVLSRHSAELEKYRAAKLLPGTSSFSQDPWDASTVHVVGDLPPGTTKDDWDTVVGRLNGAFGIELQGDLHVVLVTDDKVDDPDGYVSALRAHWWSKEMGKAAFAKNGLALVLGSTPGSSTIEWARAFSGMPEGNRALEAQLTDELPGTAFTPEAAIGAPTVTNPGSDDPKFAHSDGVTDTALWGPNKYTRICMGCDDEGDTGTGYVYLKSNVDAPTGAKVATVVVGWLLNAGLLAGLIAYAAGSMTGSGTSYRARYGRTVRFKPYSGRY